MSNWTGSCSADGCENTPVTRGLCNKHYQAWYRVARADKKRQSDRRWRARVDYNATLRKPQETRFCSECGASFETAIPHKKFCSPKHKKRAENRRLRRGRRG